MLKYLLQIVSIVLAISLLTFNIFYAKVINNSLPLILICVLCALTFILYGYRKIDKRMNKIKIMLIFGFTFAYQSVSYLIGVKTGYITNYGFIFKNYLSIKVVFNIFITLFAREVFRYLIVNVRTKNKFLYYLLQALCVIFCFMVDLNLAPKKYVFTTFSMIYEFVALFLVPNLSKNIFLSYLSKNSGYFATYVYIIVMDLNIYLTPYRSEFNMLFQSIILLVFPYLIYMYFSSFDNKHRDKLIDEKREKKNNKVVSFITTVVFVITVCLVSREFDYAMIGVGSGSMTGTINKGDAIIYQKYDTKRDEIKGQVIVFRKNNVLIVHRVLRKYIYNGKEVYQTKGDFNESPDNWVVSPDEIVGVVKYRVPIIAWPSVLLGELF